MSARPRYWFPAKKYGWGWGMPTTWQGAVALLAFAVLLLGGAWLFDPATEWWAYAVYAAVLSAIFLAVCWRTGEPPRWQWGKK